MLKIRAAMDKRNLTYSGLASLLGISEKTAKNKVAGRSEFTYGEARKVKAIFPEYDLDYLMSTEAEA
jgi:plasmid maintenance system antidote protein VapI